MAEFMHLSGKGGLSDVIDIVLLAVQYSLPIDNTKHQECMNQRSKVTSHYGCLAWPTRIHHMAVEGFDNVGRSPNRQSRTVLANTSHNATLKD